MSFERESLSGVETPQMGVSVKAGKKYRLVGGKSLTFENCERLSYILFFISVFNFNSKRTALL